MAIAWIPLLLLNFKTAQQDGDWHSIETWGESPPTSTDRVDINGYNIYASNNANCLSLVDNADNKGSLNLRNNAILIINTVTVSFSAFTAVFPPESQVMANAGTYGPSNAPMTPKLSLWNVLEEAGGSFKPSNHYNDDFALNKIKARLRKCLNNPH